jgi:ABC-type Fe3+-hydroxamate transport system substrate-binding protein
LIIEISGLPAGKLEFMKQDWNKLSILTAVKKGKIYFLADDYLLIPGVRVAQTAEHLGRIIHPEVFDE